MCAEEATVYYFFVSTSYCSLSLSYTPSYALDGVKLTRCDAENSIPDLPHALEDKGPFGEMKGKIVALNELSSDPIL